MVGNAHPTNLNLLKKQSSFRRVVKSNARFANAGLHTAGEFDANFKLRIVNHHHDLRVTRRQFNWRFCDDEVRSSMRQFDSIISDN